MTPDIEDLAKEIYNLFPLEAWDREDQDFKLEPFEDVDDTTKKIIRTIARHLAKKILEARLSELHMINGQLSNEDINRIQELTKKLKEKK